jgi:hypothetical protein
MNATKADFYLCPLALAQAALDGTQAALGGAGLSNSGWMGSPGSDLEPDALVLLEAKWTQWDQREAFEAQAGVTPLGAPWELIPDAAVAFLESLRQALAPARAERVGVAAKNLSSAADPNVPIDSSHTVAQAFRKACPQFA